MKIITIVVAGVLIIAILSLVLIGIAMITGNLPTLKGMANDVATNISGKEIFTDNSNNTGIQVKEISITSGYEK